MATDLRFITSAMKMSADLERIGDQAVNIAESALRILETPLLKPVIDIAAMAEMRRRCPRRPGRLRAPRRRAGPRGLQRDDEVDDLKDRCSASF